MSEPKRIQRKRSKGWRMPDGGVYVGRPTRFGNPFELSDFWKAGYSGSESVAREACVAAFWQWHRREPFTLVWPDELTRWCIGMHVNDCMPDVSILRGKDLACWCPLDQPCHADVLLELANR